MEDDQRLEQHWVEFASLQERLRKKQTINHKAWALEDKADAFLEAVANSSLPAETEQRGKWLDNLETNRKKKHRHRARILQLWVPEVTISSSARVQLDLLIRTEQLIVVHNSTNSQEWRILRRLALQHSYKTVADDEQISVAALKVKVWRCRQRLRVRLSA